MADRILVIPALLLLTIHTGVGLEHIPLLSLPDLTGWEEKIFTTPAHYAVVPISGRQARKATSSDSASALLRKLDIDLTSLHGGTATRIGAQVIAVDGIYF